MNAIALAFIKAHEGCSLTAYQDQGGVWTCGWGATGSDITKTTVWTQEQADQWLEAEIEDIEPKVVKLIGKALSEQSMAALISFVYNLGTQALASSHLLQCILQGDYLGASKAFLVWSHIGQKEIKGLLIRRLDEAALFLRGT